MTTRPRHAHILCLQVLLLLLIASAVAAGPAVAAGAGSRSAGPVTTLTTPALSTDKSAKPSFPVKWAATDATGIATYDVDVRDGYDADWETWQEATTATSASYLGEKGHTYYFRARAVSLASVTGDYSIVAKTTVPFDDTAGPSCVYSRGWAKAGLAGSFGGSVHRCATSGKTVTFAFTGTRVVLIASKGPKQGSARIYLDGVAKASVSLYASKAALHKAVYTGTFATSGAHKIKVKSTTAKRLEVDGFAVVQPDLPAFTYTTAPATITGAVTWTAAESPYVVDHTDIQAGASLTIQPGVVVKFLDDGVGASGSGMDVYGTLNATGTAAAPIIFTSMEDDTAAGDTNGDGAATTAETGSWTSIWADSAGRITLAYTAVRYGGSDWGGGYAAVDGSSGFSRLNVDHTTFSGDVYGFRSDSATTLTLTNCTFQDQTEGCAWISSPPSGTSLTGNVFPAQGKSNGICLSGHASGVLTLPGSGTYTVAHNGLSVPTGAVLSIQPGAVVKFLDSSSGIWVDGTLTTAGTAASPIVFTSVKDDSSGGDTNGDGAATTPAVADWARIEADANATVNLSYVTVSYGAGTDAFGAESGAVQGDTASAVTIDHATFAHDGYAVRVGYVATFHLSNCTFSANRDGCVWIVQPPADLALDATNVFQSGGVRIDGFPQAALTALPGGVTYTTSGISVPAGRVLTMGPGAVMKFISSTAGLDVSGTLTAVGTAASPIVFTSFKDGLAGATPASGDWTRIEARGNASVTLGYAKVQYGSGNDDFGAESGAVQGDGQSIVKLDHVTFSHNGYPVYITYGKTFWVSNCSFSNNDRGSIWIVEPPADMKLDATNAFNGARVRIEGSFQGDSLLPGITYTTQSLSVPAGRTVTVAAGAIMKFSSQSASLDVSGTLTAPGTATAPIYFTSASNTPAAGDWRYIRILSTGKVTLRHVTVSYGGSLFSSSPSGATNGAVENEGGVLDADLCNFIADKGAVTTYTSTAATTVATHSYWGNPAGPSYPGNANGYAGPGAISFHYDGQTLVLDVDFTGYSSTPVS